jgi:hypothetical protein
MTMQNRWVSWICPSSGTLSTIEHDVWETGSVSVFRWVEGDTLIGPLERVSLIHWTPPRASPEDRNRPSCRNSVYNSGRWTKSRNPSMLCYAVCPQSPLGVLKNCGAQTNWASHMRFEACGFCRLRTNNARIVSTHSSLTSGLPLLLRSWTLQIASLL